MQISHKNSTTKRNKPIQPPNECRDFIPQQEVLTPAIEKNFDIVLDSARAEYQGIVYHTWATQNAKLHTYLWLSVAIISAEGALFLSMLKEFPPNTDILFILFFAMCVAFASFGLGVDSMRSRQNVMRPVYGDDYSYATEIAEGGWDILLRKETIKALGNCIKIQVSEVDFLGKRMRNISLMLLTSSIIGASAFMCYAISKVFRC